MNGRLKSKKVLIFGVILFLCVIVAALMCGILFKSDNSENAKINVYFLSVDMGANTNYDSNSSNNEIRDMHIVAEKRAVKNGSELLRENKKNEYVNAVKDELLNVSATSNLYSAIPENVSVLSCKYVETDDEGKVEINFSKEYDDLSDSQQLTCNAAVTKTFTELDFVESVEIFSDGNEIKKGNGEAVGEIKNEVVELDPSIEPYKKDSITVRLYFSDENAMGLCEEERYIEVNEKQSVEMRIVEELIKGPQNERFFSGIPEATKINDIKTENGICYVDLSKEFVSQHTGGSSGESLTIYSIVNSLTELDYVKQVQFLIDGVKETSLAGHMDFSKTFERNESYINEED